MNANPSIFRTTTITYDGDLAEAEAGAREQAAAWFGSVPHRLVATHASRSAERGLGGIELAWWVETDWHFEACR